VPALPSLHRQVPEAAGVSSATAERERLAKPEELAERWGVPVSQVYRLARDEKLRVVKLGRYRRFRWCDVLDFEANGGAGE
jgi:excisionase family DNA binding protein